MQTDLNNLYQWANNNKMKFNDDKFEHIIFTNHHYDNQSAYHTPAHLIIETKEIVTDLGVRVSSDAKFTSHILNMVKEAQRLSHWILRTFKTRDTYTMKTLLKSLIIPKVEYASPVWAPVDQQSINLIENIQIRFTRRIREFNTYDDNLQMLVCTTNYWERLNKLKIYSLQRRRDRYQILLLYKMIIGIHPCIGFNYSDIKYSERRNLTITPIHNKGKRTWVKTLRGNFFATRAIQIYNYLPVNMRMLEDNDLPSNLQVTHFKTKLDKWLHTIPDEPTYADRHTAATSNSIYDQVMYIRHNAINKYGKC